MRLKQARQAAGLTQPQAVAQLRHAPNGFDVPMLSRCESGFVVPTPPTLRELAALYGTEIAALYEPAELDYGLGGPKKPAGKAGGKEAYKLTVRLDPGLASRLMEALDVLGIDGPTAWVTRYARYTVRRARLAAGKTRTDVDGTPTSGARDQTMGRTCPPQVRDGTRCETCISLSLPSRGLATPEAHSRQGATRCPQGRDAPPAGALSAGAPPAGEKKSAAGAATPAGAGGDGTAK